MYVRMYACVCMCVCLNVCIYVCMHARMLCCECSRILLYVFVAGLTVKVVHSSKDSKEVKPPSHPSTEVVPAAATAPAGGGLLFSDPDRHCACAATLHKLVRACLRVYVYVCMNICMHACVVCMRMYVGVMTIVCTHVSMYVCMYVCVLVSTCRCMYARLHT